jgi:hypothetical protein
MVFMVVIVSCEFILALIILTRLARKPLQETLLIGDYYV